jgi:hypothetical protein
MYLILILIFWAGRNWNIVAEHCSSMYMFFPLDLCHLQKLSQKKIQLKKYHVLKTLFVSQWHSFYYNVQQIKVLPSMYIIEPHHDKTNIMGLWPAWIQTSLRIRTVLSGSMLFAISFSTCYRVCKRTRYVGFVVTRLICWYYDIVLLHVQLLDKVFTISIAIFHNYTWHLTRFNQ